MLGARIGATPSTSISRLITTATVVTAVEVAHDRHGDHCRGRRAHALENPQDAEDRDARCEDRQQRSQDMDADSGKQRLFAAESVRERPDQQLSECEADESSGDRQLKPLTTRLRDRRRYPAARAGTCRW